MSVSGAPPAPARDARPALSGWQPGAFASLADMLGWGGHLLAPHGVWLAMKGKAPDEELSGVPAGFAVRGIHALAVPGLEAERSLVVLGRTAG